MNGSPSVKVGQFNRETGSKSSCKRDLGIGIYNPTLLYEWEKDIWHGELITDNKKEDKEYQENILKIIKQYNEDETYIYLLLGHF